MAAKKSSPIQRQFSDAPAAAEIRSYRCALFPAWKGAGVGSASGKYLSTLCLRAFVVTATRAAGPLQLPERAAQRFDFLLVTGFLPLGQFGQFQHVLHLVESALERLDDLRDLVNRLTDGGALRPARRRTGVVLGWTSWPPSA